MPTKSIALSLRKIVDEQGQQTYTMIQRPVQEFLQLRDQVVRTSTILASWPPVAVTSAGDLSDRNFVLRAFLRPGTARSCGIRIRTGDDEFTEIGYDRQSSAVYVDRRKSGNVDFHDAFAGRHAAPTRIINGVIELQMIVDRSTIEVFINDGEAVISDRIFPSGDQPVIEIFSGDPSAKVEGLSIHQLKSIWRK